LSLLAGIHILIADDNLLNQKIVSLILKRYGGVVSFASNGNEVIKMVKDERYDVILMDVQMPELDGFATTRVLRNDMKSTIPVIALTADKYLDESIAFNEVGMNGYISKPFEPEELCKLILELVEKNKAPNGAN
jgi:CheY-like chemotaxis protein